MVNEAQLFARYLADCEIDEAGASLYERAVAKNLGVTDSRDDAFLAFAARHPWALACLDGGLALRRPDSTVRKKLLIMAAILESRPELCNRFLPGEHTAVDAIRLVWSALRAIGRGVVGCVLVAWIR